MTTLVGVWLNNLLSHRRELERLRLESFEKFRNQFYENPMLEKVREKLEAGQPLNEIEIENYVGFFEEVGLYVDRRYVEEELVDEIFGDYISETISRRLYH